MTTELLSQRRTALHNSEKLQPFLSKVFVLVSFDTIYRPIVGTNEGTNFKINITRSQITQIIINMMPIAMNIRIRAHFFTVRVIKVWNKLPPSIVVADSVTSFGRGLNSLRSDFYCV